MRTSYSFSRRNLYLLEITTVIITTERSGYKTRATFYWQVNLSSSFFKIQTTFYLAKWKSGVFSRQNWWRHRCAAAQYLQRMQRNEQFVDLMRTGFHSYSSAQFSGPIMTYHFIVMLKFKSVLKTIVIHMPSLRQVTQIYEGRGCSLSPQLEWHNHYFDNVFKSS